MDPAPFTLRSLVAMAEGRQRSEWDRTAALLAMLANINRDPRRSKPVRPEALNPYRNQKETCDRLNRAESMQFLRQLAQGGLCGGTAV